MSGLFITFEGTEGCGKTTQLRLLADRLNKLNFDVLTIREPGGTPIGEEIRHTLKHSLDNHAMTPEAELLLINASRAQLVRELIRPALAQGRIVLCDRFFDSTVAYQGYGRELDLAVIREMIDFTVGETRPTLTLLLEIDLELSESRRRGRAGSTGPARDRMEEAGRAFFERVEAGYRALAATEPNRIRQIDGRADPNTVCKAIWTIVEPLVTAVRRP